MTDIYIYDYCVHTAIIIVCRKQEAGRSASHLLLSLCSQCDNQRSSTSCHPLGSPFRVSILPVFVCYHKHNRVSLEAMTRDKTRKTHKTNRHFITSASVGSWVWTNLVFGSSFPRCVKNSRIWSYSNPPVDTVWGFVCESSNEQGPRNFKDIKTQWHSHTRMIMVELRKHTLCEFFFVLAYLCLREHSCQCLMSPVWLTHWRACTRMG
jgi:hypothetical protein